MKMKGLLFRFFPVLAGLIAIMVLTLTTYLFRRQIVLQKQSNSDVKVLFIHSTAR